MKRVESAIAELAAGGKPGADGFVRLDVRPSEWKALAAGCAAGEQDMLALWHEPGRMRVALLARDRKTRAIVSVGLRGRGYPSFGAIHAPAIRLERTMRDLHGVRPEGLSDDRPWLDHGVWPDSRTGIGGYAFLPVEGEGLHQVPVGPVHAGIIEPGHFRFTANGEAVVRLEERLGYTHKGVEALCAGRPVEEAIRIVGRQSGDSTVAYAFAFARAVENACGMKVTKRASQLRGIFAELERMANHVGDFGAICNDASAVAIHAHCSLLRERILQKCRELFGHRLLMDRIVPGGVAVDIDADGAAGLLKLLDELEKDFAFILRSYDRSPSILDRTVSTGHLSRELAERFAAGGHVGRASGRDFDSRRDLAYAPYDGLHLRVVTRQDGDVNARAWVRAEEFAESIAILRQLLGGLEAGSVAATGRPSGPGEGVGVAEAFRGEVFVAVALERDGTVAHVHARDPSWFQWPLLEAAIEGNIIADFPLCNKSFNCSYSGVDM